MSQPLRPMNLGEILDRTFQIYRARFLAFVGIAAIPMMALELVRLADRTWLHVHSLVHPTGQFQMSAWNFVVGLGFYHIFSVLGILIEPAIVEIASSSALGDECSITSSLRFALLRWPRYLWLGLLKTLLNLGIPEFVFLLLATGAAFLADATGLLGKEFRWMLLLLALAVVVAGFQLFLWLLACFSFAIPAAALEDRTAFQSLRRSWTLTKGTRARIWFTWLAVFLTSSLLAWGLSLLLWQIFRLLGSSASSMAWTRSLYYASYFILNAAVGTLVLPIFPIALTLFYYDQRIRHEGFDIERMMDVAGLNPPAMLAAEESAAAQQTPLPTEEETLA
jgi:hypothetical protein